MSKPKNLFANSTLAVKGGAAKPVADAPTRSPATSRAGAGVYEQKLAATNKRTQALNLRISEEDKRRFKAQCAANGEDMADVIERAIEMYVKGEL